MAGYPTIYQVIDPSELDLVTMTGFDQAVLGVVDFEGKAVVVYDRSKVIEQLMDEGSGSYEEAVEYHEFNQVNMHMWLFLDRITDLLETQG